MSRQTKKIDYALQPGDFVIEQVRRILRRCKCPEHWGEPEAVFLYLWVAKPELADVGFPDSAAYRNPDPKSATVKVPVFLPQVLPRDPRYLIGLFRCHATPLPAWRHRRTTQESKVRNGALRATYFARLNAQAPEPILRVQVAIRKAISARRRSPKGRVIEEISQRLLTGPNPYAAWDFFWNQKAEAVADEYRVSTSVIRHVRATLRKLKTATAPVSFSRVGAGATRKR
jgi:hypothetical protein